VPGAVALHVADDRGPVQKADVHVARFQRLVGELVMARDPLLLVEQEPARADRDEVVVDKLAQPLAVVMKLSLVELVLQLLDGVVAHFSFRSVASGEYVFTAILLSRSCPGGGLAAVDRDDGTRDERRLVGGEPDDERGDLVDGAAAPQRNG